jgi:hypothetical protein
MSTRMTKHVLAWPSNGHISLFEGKKQANLALQSFYSEVMESSHTLQTVEQEI